MSIGPEQSASWLVLAALTIAFSGACSSSVPTEDKPPRPVVLDTEYDDRRAGQDASQQVAAEMGVLKNPELTKYIRQVGMKMVRFAPLRSFDYTFRIVDQPMPNAFALPGGHIYVSRGMLALANNEDELANVLGHEITHSAARHAAAQQELARRSSPLAMPYLRMAQMASYSRDHERDADQGGQFLAASAGYNAMGMSTFLRKLGNSERMEVGYSRLQSYADTHPGSTERSAATANRAQSMQPGSTHQTDQREASYLKHINGLVLGTNPAEGIFKGSLFLHPDMNFHIRFPQGWQLVNSPQSVGAMAPRGAAIISLTAESSGD
ncbi:MAG: M48 family metallopeptidase, partial [Myxococcota bacterium]